jgi:glycosyltransferase involved in cell wall biosynthesis
MKILHIDPDDIENPMSGGGPRRTHEIYRRMASRHEITVLTPTFAGSTAELVRDGVRFVRLGRRVGDHGSSHHITFFFALPFAIQRFEYDLLVEDFMPPMSVTLNPLFNRRPLVASVQWFFAESLSAQYGLPFAWGERWGVRLYRHFVVLSDSMRARIRALRPGADCEVIPEGVEEGLYELPIVPGDFALFLGRVDFRQKGVDLLLQAYARVPSNLRIPLVLAGHGDQWQTLADLVRRLGLEPWVRSVGRVGPEERERLLGSCRFVCFPSREETFGMVLAEACASGKAVVAFDAPPMNEVAAPDACELVPPFDVEGYAAAIARLLKLKDAELVERGARCRAWAGRFRWEDLARRQEAYYQDVVDGRRP